MNVEPEDSGTGVIVAIPTFGRAQLLERAARSVLAQDHPDILLLISDNASTDETPLICQALADADPRVLVHRQQRNIGLTENFNWLMRRALQQDRRKYGFFMFLADDDWLEPNYAGSCVTALEPGCVMSAGRTLCHVEGEQSWFAPDVNLNADHALDRVADFCRGVLPSGAFSGVMRLDTLARLPPQRNAIGNDWLLFGNIAFLGKVATVTETTINRTGGGASTTSFGLAATLGVSRVQAVKPLMTVMFYFLLECLYRSPVFKQLPVSRRLRLAAVTTVSLIERRILAAGVRFSRRDPARVKAVLRRACANLIGR